MSFDAQAIVRALRPWDIIYPFDTQVCPNKHKMWACVSRSDLWFYRINTLSYGEACYPLTQATHGFLTHDSFLGLSGDLIHVSEIALEHYLARQEEEAKQGIVGKIDAAARQNIRDRISDSATLSPSQIRTMLAELVVS